jgi:hypothetical protein
MEKRLTYEDFEKIGTITRLPEIEKEDYIKRYEIYGKKIWKLQKSWLN